MTDLEPADRGRLADALADAYGVPPQALEGWHLRAPEGGDVVFAAEADPTQVPAPAVRAGVRLGAWTDAGFRLSIEGADLLEEHLEPVLDVGDERAQPWLAGDDVPAPEGAPEPFAVLRWDGRIVGVGEVRDGVVVNDLPRSRRIAHPPWEEGAAPGQDEPGGGGPSRAE